DENYFAASYVGGSLERVEPDEPGKKIASRHSVPVGPSTGEAAVRLRLPNRPRIRRPRKANTESTATIKAFASGARSAPSLPNRPVSPTAAPAPPATSATRPISATRSPLTYSAYVFPGRYEKPTSSRSNSVLAGASFLGSSTRVT